MKYLILLLFVFKSFSLFSQTFQFNTDSINIEISVHKDSICKITITNKSKSDIYIPDGFYNNFNNEMAYINFSSTTQNMIPCEGFMQLIKIKKNTDYTKIFDKFNTFKLFNLNISYLKEINYSLKKDIIKCDEFNDFSKNLFCSFKY
jgi:hypothetical protein